MHQIIIQTFINNELKKRVQTEPYRRKTSDPFRLNKKARLEKELKAVNSLANSTAAPRFVQWREALLTSIENLAKKHRWGSPNPPRKFTASARHRILEAGAVMDKLLPGKTYMATMTIPGGTPAALQAVANYSGGLVDRMLKKLRRSPGGKDVMWFYVWEFQGQNEERDCALHMHWAVAHSDEKVSKASAELLEYFWFELLLEMGETELYKKRHSIKIGVDCFERKRGGTWRNNPGVWQSNVQKVQKSVAAYYSKYCSKDSTNQVLLKKSKSSSINYPASWWGSSTSVKNVIKQWRSQYKIDGLTKDESDLVSKWIWEILDMLKLKEPQKKLFCITHPRVSVPLCSGSVQIVFGNPETWLETCELIRSLFEVNPGYGAGGIVIEELVKEAKKQLQSTSPPTPNPHPAHAGGATLPRVV